jgi:hypothetical protein
MEVSDRQLFVYLQAILSVLTSFGLTTFTNVNPYAYLIVWEIVIIWMIFSIGYSIYWWGEDT